MKKFLFILLGVLFFASCDKDTIEDDENTIIKKEERNARDVANSISEVYSISIQSVSIEGDYAIMYTTWNYKKWTRLGYKNANASIIVNINNIHKTHGKLKWEADWGTATSQFYNVNK